MYGGRMVPQSSPSPQTPSPSPSMPSPYSVAPTNDPANLFSTINQQQQMSAQYIEPNLNPNYASPTYSNYHPTNSQLPHYSQTPQWNLSPSPNTLHPMQQQMSPHNRVQQTPMNNLNSNSYNVANLITVNPENNLNNVKDGDQQQMDAPISSNIENLLNMDSQQPDPNSLSNVSLSLFHEQQLTTSFTQLSTGTMNDFNNL
jgi:hypothetical protein